jgi:hypothetical protein
MDATPDIFSVLHVAGNSSNTTNEQMEEGHRTEFFGGAFGGCFHQCSGVALPNWTTHSARWSRVFERIQSLVV